MKIFYFTPFWPPQSEAAATRAFWFVKILRESGHQVTTISPGGMFFSLASNRDPFLARLWKENLVGLELFFRILLSSSDRLVLSSPPFFTISWGILACFLRRKKYILDVRDLYPEVFFEMGLIKEHSLPGKLVMKITACFYKKASGILTVTKGLVREVLKYGPESSKVVLAMNGYDPQLFFPGPEDGKFEKFTLVFHGNLGKVQNIDTLLALAKELETYRDVEIVVAGEGPKLEEILRAKRSNVSYLGSLSYEKIPQLLRRCHVGLSFRTDDKIGREAFPVKVFEYVGSGLPVIMAPTGEAGEIVESGGFGWQFENAETKAMVERILSLKTKQVGETSRAPEEFTRSRQSEKLLALLNPLRDNRRE